MGGLLFKRGKERILSERRENTCVNLFLKNVAE